jgi:ABC-type sugar transport system ATPase subunit
VNEKGGQGEQAISGGEAPAAPFLEVRALSKRYGSIKALDNVSLRVQSGEVHGLVGANGAGKSTLVRILAGAASPDSGSILVDGSVVSINDPLQATALGFGVIHQELNLVPRLSALENLTLGLKKPTRAGVFIDWRSAERQVATVAKRLDMRFSLRARADSLSVADQWLVAIGRSLLRRTRLLAMDEPTASLSDDECLRLFDLVRELATSGVAVLYVTHRLHEVVDLCDVATVLRDGRLVRSVPRSELSQSLLVREIIGRTAEPSVQVREPSVDATPQGVGQEGAVILEVRHLVRKPAVQDVSFSLHAGEVLGLAGLVGAGRTEVVRLVFGADRLQAGDIILNGQRLGPLTPHRAVSKGIALVPEERRSQGLVLAQSLTFNVNLASLERLRLGPRVPLISNRRGRERAAEQVRHLGIKSPGVATAVGQLSGGNQQKVVLGRWLACDAQVLLLDEPTRGVDVGARAEMYLIIKGLASEGRGVLMITSELDEFAQCCDRVLVMAEGRIVGELMGPEITEERILGLCYGAGKLQ